MKPSKPVSWTFPRNLFAGDQAGLFDRTHRILRGKSSHRRHFRQAGYWIIDEYQTDHIIGTTGDWNWQSGDSAATHLEAEIARRTASNHWAARYLTQVYSASQRHRIARKAVEAAFVYQGLYVITTPAPGLT